MKFSDDIWTWLKFVIGLIRLLKEIFGDDEDKEDLRRNGNPFKVESKVVK